MKAATKKLVVISDTHIGSTVGLWPKGFVSHEGYQIGRNPFQDWLGDCWEDLQKWVKSKTEGKPYELLINGDLVEGIHHNSLQVMSPDRADQVSACEQLLRPMTSKASKLYIVKGTESHTRNDEIHIGRVLGAVKDKTTGHHAFDRLDLEYGDHLVAASHHMSSAVRPYSEATAHCANLASEIQERARCGKRPPTIIIRAHRHVHGMWADGLGMSLSTGAWQGLTRFGNRVVPHCIPRPSCFILDFEGISKGDMPLVHQRIYIAE